MEDNLTNGFSFSVTHLLQHTLRSLCHHENSQWVYAVFWRILPRNYPPPKWDIQAGPYDRLRGNRRNWILVWEDGFCNFSAAARITNRSDSPVASSTSYTNMECSQHPQGLQPELFFKMSHEIYNYGEGLIGKVAADHNHKWIFREPNENELNSVSTWHNPADSYPRTWESQFRAGIQTIALIAVREGVIQLGAVNKVMEDINHIFLLRQKFSYIDNIPGVLLPHPSCAAFPLANDGTLAADNAWVVQANPIRTSTAFSHGEYSDYLALGSHLHGLQELKITPSMTSLEALLSKLPSVEPISSGTATYASSMSTGKGKMEEDEDYGEEIGLHFHGQSSSSMYSYHRH